MGRTAQWPPPIYPRRGVDRCRIWRDGAPHDYTLGPSGSAESRAEYARLLAELGSSGGLTADRQDVTVLAVCVAHLRWAQGYHEPRTYARIVRALGPVERLYGHRPAVEFGPRALKTVVQAYVDEGLARRYCNALRKRVQAAWRWAVSEEMVPESAADALFAVEPLRRGKTTAPERPARRPADPAAVALTLPQLPPIVADMVRLQQLTAARPGEVCALRPGDTDRGWKTIDGHQWWLYRLDEHKGDWRGHERWIPLGPAAQRLLLPYLAREAGTYCFSPREVAEAWLREHGRKVNFRRSRSPGLRYNVCAYDKVVRKACLRAGVEPWTPHQLRHLVATEIQTELSQEDARCVLGHRTPDVTAVYAQSVERGARALARREGIAM